VQIFNKTIETVFRKLTKWTYEHWWKGM